MSHLVGIPEDQFSRVAAHVVTMITLVRKTMNTQKISRRVRITLKFC